MPTLSIFQPVPSRLTLGTAQFGLTYGIANRTGRPSFRMICEILSKAYNSGVNVLDTAAAYGEGEKIIGHALRKLGLQACMRVVTKVATLPSGMSKKKAAARIEAGLRLSLLRLGVEQIPLVLFHEEENIEYTEELLVLRRKGIVGAIGVSLVRPEFAHRALEIPELQAWQVPSSLLDRRFTHSGLTKAAGMRGITVFARSIFLQGLLLMSDDKTPVHLREVVEPRRRLKEIALSSGLSLRELAVRAMLSQPDVHSLVIGVETAMQLEENLILFRKGPLPPELKASLEIFKPELSDLIVNPGSWERAARGAVAS